MLVQNIPRHFIERRVYIIGGFRTCLEVRDIFFMEESLDIIIFNFSFFAKVVFIAKD
jgi:hypothetical protein